MGLKLIYFIKHSLIVTLSIVILGFVETAPDRPILFAFIFTTCILSIRLLWNSAIRDEKEIKKQIRFCKRTKRLPQKFKEAA